MKQRLSRDKTLMAVSKALELVARILAEKPRHPTLRDMARARAAVNVCRDAVADALADIGE